MATAVVPQQKVRSDDIFFPAMALLILGMVVLGFGRTYFFAGMFRAKLPNTLVHIHGALFVTWIFFLVVQASLVALRKVKWHMTLGIFGVIMIPLMAVFGVLTLFDSIRRNGTDLPPELLLAGDLSNLALFVVLTAWALLVRRNSASHKRLMILGTMAIMGPAIDRWPIPHTIIGTLAIFLGLPMLVVVYDLWSSRRVHRSTAVGYAMIATVVFTVLPVSHLGFWQQCIVWIRHT